VVPFATSDKGLIIATAALALATLLVAVPAAWSALISAQETKRDLLPVIIPAKAHGIKWIVRFTPHKHVVLENFDSYTDEDDQYVYFAVALRNIGAGIAVVLGTDASPKADLDDLVPKHVAPLSGMRRMARNMYLAKSDAAYLVFWTTSASSGIYKVIYDAVPKRQDIVLDLIYSDQDGRQMTVSRFELSWAMDVNRYVAKIVKHWRPRMFRRRKLAKRMNAAPV
jgi:hypothetical protein